MAPYNEAQKRASLKCRAASVKRIPLDVPNELYASFRAACDVRGERVNTVLRRAMVDYIGAGEAVPTDHGEDPRAGEEGTEDPGSGTA